MNESLSLLPYVVLLIFAGVMFWLWIKDKSKAEKLEALRTVAEMAVGKVEQITKGDVKKDNDLRRKYALETAEELLKASGYKFDTSAILSSIEWAVGKMNERQKPAIKKRK